MFKSQLGYGKSSDNGLSRKPAVKPLLVTTGKGTALLKIGLHPWLEMMVNSLVEQPVWAPQAPMSS